MSPSKKTTSTKKIPKSLLADIKALLKTGKNRGYIAQDEILDVFVEPEIYVEELDDLYD